MVKAARMAGTDSGRHFTTKQEDDESPPLLDDDDKNKVDGFFSTVMPKLCDSSSPNKAFRLVIKMVVNSEGS
jgi:hypothetical protein